MQEIDIDRRPGSGSNAIVQRQTIFQDPFVWSNDVKPGQEAIERDLLSLPVERLLAMLPCMSLEPGIDGRPKCGRRLVGHEAVAPVARSIMSRTRRL